MEPLYKRKTGFGRNTTVGFAWENGPLLWLQFHDTVVARFDYKQADLDKFRNTTYSAGRLKPFVVHLNNGGWPTKTTRERIDSALGMVGLGYIGVSTRKGQEYLRTVHCHNSKYSWHYQEFNGKISFDPAIFPDTLYNPDVKPWVVKYRTGETDWVMDKSSRMVSRPATATIVVNTLNKPSALLYARAMHLTNGEKIVGVSKF